MRRRARWLPLLWIVAPLPVALGHRKDGSPIFLEGLNLPLEDLNRLVAPKRRRARAR